MAVRMEAGLHDQGDPSEEGLGACFGPEERGEVDGVGGGLGLEGEVDVGGGWEAEGGVLAGRREASVVEGEGLRFLRARAFEILRRKIFNLPEHGKFYSGPALVVFFAFPGVLGDGEGDGGLGDVGPVGVDDDVGELDDAGFFFDFVVLLAGGEVVAVVEADGGA
jgi:hypothetical protein